MWGPRWIRSAVSRKPERQARSAAQRDRLAALLALVTVICFCSVLVFSKGTAFLMPGPLSSAHSGIEKCNSCHTKSGSGKLSWMHGLVAGDPHADSKACLTCHKMPDTGFNAHGASAEVLERSTERLTTIAAGLPQPQSARAQDALFPTHDVVARGLDCATCHQEHQGVTLNPNKITNEQCRSCHVVRFDSFDGHHPNFDEYPFKRRTRIIYDHDGHFGKHYPELAKKDPSKRIPATCATCHNSNSDKRVMTVVPFEQACATCHLDQITGKERVSGPKGIAFLALPGLDLQSLKTKNAAIGEWPDSSDAALTPFMKVMISRNERGRALLKIVDGLNLQDLTAASDDQIKAVTNLVWEIKTLFHALIAGKASDVLGDLNIGSGAKLSSALVADLTASIPRDVVISAQQQWLPKLAAEIANGPEASDKKQSSQSAVVTEPSMSASTLPAEPSAADAQKEPRGQSPSADVREAAGVPKRDPPTCLVRVLGQCLMSKGGDDKTGDAQSEAAARNSDTANAEGGKQPRATNELTPAMRLGVKVAETAGQPEGAAGTAADSAKPKSAVGKVAGQVGGKAENQSDDLLFPTDDELREIKAHNKNAGSAPQPDVAAGKLDGATAAAPTGATAKAETPTDPVISIASDTDPESWAEYGGWYRQDYAIFYRPIGHKDKFIYSWLFLTGPHSPKDDKSPAAAVFDVLTRKDAQGSCTKCHSVDDLPSKGRVVNFSQPNAETKRGSFTTFVHEPHFGTLENRGCLTCHSLEKGRAYLKSYEQGDPQSFASNFGTVKKELCQTCHNSSKARQDCLTCHKYHVNGVITPIMKTKIPTQ